MTNTYMCMHCNIFMPGIKVGGDNANTSVYSIDLVLSEPNLVQHPPKDCEREYYIPRKCYTTVTCTGDMLS